MKTTLLLIGKTTDKRIEQLVDEYASRLKHYITFDIRVLPELKNTKSKTIEQQKKEEGDNILNAIDDSTTLILLDEHGEQMRSIVFAQYMQKLLSAGRNVVFAIGGPYGFSPDVYQRANAKLSLSPMTMSHQIVRLFFAEQLYRAMTILKGEPYHHE
ncbi:MAG: 23S rRNA (pseudouridine(1915)-N(3))-methyltransferase RlmH [Paludibacteraceae bacterium]|nr:23S rRNA (pseudouridine(1915)-N(3))-methyltransferase RlmH [Paludibacteraceae bacterium]